MFFRILFLVILVSLQPLQAREYITQSQLQSSVVQDLPGRIGTDYMKERDPENMAANAISKMGSLLSNFSGITLGGIGGIAVLGLTGIISAPIAAIGAAAVGTLALVGTMNDPVTTQSHLGRSYMNGGMLGNPYQNVAFGAQSTNSGIMGQVFGITGQRTNYGVGSLGVSSDQRAPVHVNMQSPHVNNVYNRGYNFSAYDSGYTNDFGAVGPASATNSANLPSSSSPQAPGYGYNTNSNNFQANQMMSNGYYDRRGDQTFTDFFVRSDSNAMRTAPQGDYNGASRNMYSNPSYDVNWRNTVGNQGASLSTSNQYAGKSFSNMSPQGQVMQGAYSQGSAMFNNSYTPNVQANRFRTYPNNQFQGPTQNYDVFSTNQYPMGNGYFTNNLANNYDRGFQGSNGFVPNQGYMPSASLNTQAYGVAPQLAPGTLAQPSIYTPNSNSYTSGVFNTAAPTILPNDMINPEEAQARIELIESNGQSTYNNSNQVMMGAMAPVSSFQSVDELQLEKKRLYDKVLESVRNNDEQSRLIYFKQYSLITEKLDTLLAE